MYSFKNLGDNLLNYNSNERINEDQNNDFNPYKKLDNQYNYPSKDKKFIKGYFTFNDEDFKEGNHNDINEWNLEKIYRR